MNRGWVEGANHRSIDVEGPDSDDHPDITVLTVRGQRGGILAVVELTGDRAGYLRDVLASEQLESIRDYLSDLRDSTSRCRDWMRPPNAQYDSYSAQLEIIDAVTSFVDGQADGTVTRG